MRGFTRSAVCEVEMSTSEPMDPQRYGATPQPSGLPPDLEATLPLASPPQPLAPPSASRQTLPPPLPAMSRRNLVEVHSAGSSSLGRLSSR